MIKVTEQQLLAIMPNAKNKAKLYLPYVNGYAETFKIDTPLRMAHFLAQVAHETMELTHIREIGNEVYCHKYEVGKLAKMLGNTQKGDGYRYKGRGMMHLTGRANYQAYTNSKYCRGDVVNEPQLLEKPLGATKSGMWYWWSRGLNEIADTDNIVAVTKKVNGGTNGIESRKKYLARAKKALGMA